MAFREHKVEDRRWPGINHVGVHLITVVVDHGLVRIQSLMSDPRSAIAGIVGAEHIGRFLDIAADLR